MVDKEYCKNGHLLSETRKLYPSGGSYCCLCKVKRRREYYQLNHDVGSEDPKRKRVRKLKSKYGISDADFQLIKNSQNNACAIQEPFVRQGCVDHDHDSGLIRGILCNGCNCGLGYFKDNIKSLERAIDYLKEAEVRKLRVA